MCKFKAGDKVRIINRKPTNETGSYPECYLPHAHEGNICYLCARDSVFGLRENVDGTGKYFGIYSDGERYFNDDDLELVDFVLPEKWCVKVTEENKDVIHRWKLDNTKCSTFTSAGSYVTNTGTFSTKVNSDYTEITHEQFQTHVLKQTEMTIQKITLGQLKDLYNESSCNDWRNRIVAYINANTLAKDYTSVIIRVEDISYAHQNANKNQLDLLKAAGIKFEQKPKYKVGDYITVVKGKFGQAGEEGETYKIHEAKTDERFLYIESNMCIDTDEVQIRPATEEEIAKAKCPYKDGDLLLVKNNQTWELRYSTGIVFENGHAVCYTHQKKKSLESMSWEKHKLANIELPNE